MSIPASTVNLSLPIQLQDADEGAPPTFLALGHWLLPRVPCIGEHVVIEAIRRRVEVESVWWDIEGRATVTLQEARLGPDALEALERDGWGVASFEDEPPSDWLAG
jgi:hypothetical protein